MCVVVGCTHLGSFGKAGGPRLGGREALEDEGGAVSEDVVDARQYLSGSSGACIHCRVWSLGTTHQHT